MSQKLSLEVKLPLGTDKQKTFEFQSSTAIKDAVAEIVRDQDGRGADLYTLASNNKGICKHYNPSSTFEACGIDSKVNSGTPPHVQPFTTTSGYSSASRF